MLANIQNKILYLLAPSCVVIMVAYLTNVDRLAFNFQPGRDGHYGLVFTTALVLCLYIFLSLLQPLKSVNSLVFCLLAVIWCCIRNDNEYLNTILCLLVLCILVSGAPIKVLSVTFCYGTVGFLIYQLGVALIQHVRGELMTGTLENTGVFTNYLSITVPSLYFVFWLPGRGKVFPVIGIILLAFIIVVIGKDQSRTALIGVAIVAAGLCLHYFRGRNRGKRMPGRLKLFYFPVATIGAVCIILYSLSIKQLSAAGRVLLNKIALLHIGDHFWLGTGLGRFTWYYPQWQSDYFSHNPGEGLRLSAGESYIIFNEYLQLFETIGVPGFILFIAALVWFFTTRSVQRSELLAVIKLTVVAILACGFTSYPLHVNVILFYFILCFCLAFKLDERTGYRIGGLRIFSGLEKIGKKIKIAVLITSLLGFGYCIGNIARRDMAVQSWLKLKEANLTYGEQKDIYASIYPLLRGDGKFLTDYGIFLLEDSLESSRALQILAGAREKFISRETMMALGNAYWKVNDLRNAAACFEFVKNYIPYTFEPKYNLMRVYLESGNYSQARAMADLIINTSPKIPSDKVTFIKRETVRMLHTINFNVR